MDQYLKALKNYAVFDGRARRQEYWMFFLFNLIIAFGIGFIGGLIKIPLLGTLYSLVLFLPSLAVGVRRLHDIDKSGWYILIPIYNIILLATVGDSGDNQYGADPKSAPVTA